MDTRSILSGLALFPLLCGVAVPVSAQTAKPAPSSRQQGADAASRNQLAAYMAEFQNHPEDATLRSEIVELAKTMNPAPAIPQAARDSFAQATAQLNAASSADGFNAAAKLFERAALQAPWFADADLSAASAYEQGSDPDDARRNLALYLAAARPGADTRRADELTREIEGQQSSQQFQQTLQKFNSNPSDAARLQIIKLSRAMMNPPEVPEEARGHYVKAQVLMNSAEDNPEYEQRAIEEYKAALLAAPWWADAYKKLAAAQTAAGQFDDASASLNFYMLAEPAQARNTQDEIYRLEALGQKAADEHAKQQAEEQQRKLHEEEQQNEIAATAARKYTVEGRWFQASAPNEYFVGGMSTPECDYSVKQSGGRWQVSNSCPGSKRTIEDVEVQHRQLSFRILGHDPGFPFSEVSVSFTLSEDGQSLDGKAIPYDQTFTSVGDRTVRWMRRE